jgi:hypothetical protein
MSWGLGLIFHARAALSKHVSPRALRRERKRMQAELAPGARVEQPLEVQPAAAATGGARVQDAAGPRVRVNGQSSNQSDDEAEDDGFAGTSQRKRQS